MGQGLPRPSNDARRHRSPRPSRHHLRDERRKLSTSRRARSQARSRSPARPRDNQGKALTTLSVNQTQRDGVQRQSNSGGEKNLQSCRSATIITPLPAAASQSGSPPPSSSRSSRNTRNRRGASAGAVLC